MEAVKAYFDGHSFIPESPVIATINQEAIITLLESQLSNNSKKERLLGLAGNITHDDYLEIEKALEDTEMVYSYEWQHP
jgi:hypothetical protein